ncbi:MAG: hypothetical protein AAGF01_20630 [Cyanobacteria bacterium P01_G01_bin.38]
MNSQSTSPRPKAIHPKIQQALQAYTQIVTQLDKVADTLSKQQVLYVLLLRDAVETCLQTANAFSVAEKSSILATLSDLDNALKSHAHAIVADDKLADCRRSRRPPETAWWWWLDTELAEPAGHRLDRLDWLWNGLSVSCLVFSASFLTITAQAFSAVGGFDLLQTLSTLSQATGLVLVAGGTLTDQGQKLVKTTLKKLNIPPYFHSEVTLGASALLLLGSYGVYSSLPQFSQHYYHKGLEAQRAGNLYEAIEDFKESIAFDPSYSDPHTHLAEVYQNLERFEEAQAEYQDGLLKGDISALNGMGTLILAASADGGSGELGELSGLLDAEVLFRIGLNQTKPGDERLKAMLHTNLGVTLMKRAEAEAESGEAQNQLLASAGEQFQNAIRFEQSLAQEVNNGQISNQTYGGQGVAYCFLADVYEQTGNAQQASAHWQICEEQAYPGSLEQYEDILRLGDNAVGLHLNTTHILEASQN